MASNLGSGLINATIGQLKCFTDAPLQRKSFFGVAHDEFWVHTSLLSVYSYFLSKTMS